MIEARHHAPPPPGEDQPLRPLMKSRRRSQAGGGAGFVTVNNRLFAPLQGLDPNNVLQGGYGWLDYTDGGATYHPGLDLNAGGSCNADDGLAVVAPLAGVVRAALFWNGTTPGEGNHAWVELDDPCCPGPTWWHTDHLRSIGVSVGQRLAPGDPIGTCGRTGGWDCAHAHTELLKGPPQDGWFQWPYSWSRAQVEDAYYDPSAWWNAATALVLAEQSGGPTPPPEVIEMILSGAQTAAIQAAMFGSYWEATNPAFSIPTAWRERWQRDGKWPGRAVSAEQDIPADPSENKPEGKFQLFEHGCCVWLRDVGTSWNG